MITVGHSQRYHPWPTAIGRRPSSWPNYDDNAMGPSGDVRPAPRSAGTCRLLTPGLTFDS